MGKNYIVVTLGCNYLGAQQFDTCKDFCLSLSLSPSFSLLLDDEEETAEGEKEGNEVEDEELDPLDAYMEEVKEEVKKFNMRSVKGGGGSEKVKSLVKDFLLLKDKDNFVF